MRYRTHLLSAAVAACLLGTNLHAAEPSFVGTWKIDLAKSTVTGFQAKIEDLGDQKMNFIFGDDAETYYFDGKPHPTRYGSMRTVTSEGPGKWKTVTERDGKVTGTDTWTITDGGKSLTIHSETNRPDGSTVKEESLFKRVAGTSGLAGTWENSTANPNDYPDFVVESADREGSTISVPAFKEVHKVKYDGKDHPAEGPRVAPGFTSSGKFIDERTIEFTDKIKEKVIEVRHAQLSGDGKTMTVTLTYPGIEKKEVDVYERK